MENHFPDFAGRIVVNVKNDGRSAKLEYYGRDETPSNDDLSHNGGDILRSLGFGWIPRAD